GCVEEHVPSRFVGEIHEIERVGHSREIRLSRVGKQVGLFWSDTAELFVQGVAVDVQVRRLEWHVLDRAASCDCEIADAVDGIVIVEGQQVPAARTKWVRFAYVLQCPSRVEREDGGVIAASIEVLEHVAAGALDKSGG